eukprot:4672580-Lingulodinium_polyedra.AAC.1
MRHRCRPAADQRAACRSAGVYLKFARSRMVSRSVSHRLHNGRVRSSVRSPQTPQIAVSHPWRATVVSAGGSAMAGPT